MSAQGPALTARAEAVATEQGYGARRSSHRVNRAHDRHLATGVLLLPLAAVVFLIMAWQASPRGAGDGEGSVAGMVASGVAGLVFLGLTAFLVVPLLIAMVRVRGAWVHVFAHGAIAERPGGNLYAWKLTRATVRYVCWQESREGEWRDRPQMWVTFHQDGETICFDGLDLNDRRVLPELARAHSASTTIPSRSAASTPPRHRTRSDQVASSARSLGRARQTEVGRQYPDRAFWERCDEVLDTNDALAQAVPPSGGGPGGGGEMAFAAIHPRRAHDRVVGCVAGLSEEVFPGGEGEGPGR